MTHTELMDNLTLIAAEEMLQRLVAESALTEEEAWQVWKELKKRLRPTVVASPLLFQAECYFGCI